MGMLKDILVKAADMGTNITYANVKTNSKKLGIIELGVEVNGIEKLNDVINAFLSLPDVHSVKRIQMNSKIKPTQDLKAKSKAKNKKTK
jgi:(p)ppGpp synthase/HD superfamily hydrolase